MAKPYLFIVNPKSGNSSEREFSALLRLIDNEMKSAGLVSQSVVTESRGHANEIARTAVKNSNWAAVVAVGGDGTVNEVARALLHTNIPLGIIPSGSGNGLARHLHIPMNLRSALHRLTEGSLIRIDSAQINDTPFFCTSGIGFDAAVSHRFAASTERGFKNYVRYSVSVYQKYRPLKIRLDRRDASAFLLTFANASQFGNNAWIAPKASTNDGLLDLCHIHPFPDWYSPVLGTRLFAKTLDQSRYVSYRTFREITLSAEAPVLAHFDGEPLTIENSEIRVRCVPSSLTVIC